MPPLVEEVSEVLRGPVHGRIQMLRGMCTDELPYPDLDAKLVELDEVVFRLVEVMAETADGPE
jgi:hypothetical protein